MKVSVGQEIVFRLEPITLHLDIAVNLEYNFQTEFENEENHR
jgi:hypothetical protein